MKLEIIMESKWGSIDKLRRLLEKQEGWNTTGSILEPLQRLRGVDPAILIAAVTATGVGLGALINGLLLVAQQSTTKKVIIQGRQGARLELPANTPSDKVDYWIMKLKEIDATRIIVSE